MTHSLPSSPRFGLRALSLLLLLIGPSLLAQAQLIRYVKPTATGTGSGDSWANASGNLQAIITASSSGDQVWVAQGIYKPGGNANTNRNVSFSMKNGVTIYGGFAGTEGSLSQRVPANALATILSGDIGSVGNAGDNSYSVIVNPPGLTNSAVLDGFLITGGNANSNGGGMYNNGRGDTGSTSSTGIVCSPTVRNCSFQNNSSTNGAGAMYNNGSNYGASSPVLTNCSFQGNSTTNGGGAITNNGSFGGTSSPVLTNCSFLNNSSISSAGAIYSEGYFGGTSNPVMTNCIVFGNKGNGGRGSSSIFTFAARLSASYSLFETGITDYSDGGNNRTTTVSPFVSTTDTRLNACSPAINTGNNAANTTATDLAGNPRRFNGGQIDMGAYEYQGDGGIRLTSPSVSTATVGVAFSQSFTASEGSGPYSYSLASGSLPTGLSLATTGTLSGTPTQAGSFTITVKATDAAGCSVVSTPYVLTVSVPPSPIRYVSMGATGSGNSWADASGDLQSQINVTGAQQVWVAQGTYKPTTGTDRTVSFAMKNGVAIYGGFPATGSPGSVTARNPDSFTTVLSGDIGSVGVTEDNSYHVVYNAQSQDASAVLDGVVIRDGNANEIDSYSAQSWGGGMYNVSSSPTLINCRFVTNYASANGGGYTTEIAVLP